MVSVGLTVKLPANVPVEKGQNMLPSALAILVAAELALALVIVLLSTLMMPNASPAYRQLISDTLNLKAAPLMWKLTALISGSGPEKLS